MPVADSHADRKWPILEKIDQTLDVLIERGFGGDSYSFTQLWCSGLDYEVSFKKLRCSEWSAD